MPNNYAPTINPGDTRIRTRYIGIRIPHNALPTVEILEQEVIKLKDGTEKVLQDLGNVPTDTFDPAERFPLRDIETDTEEATEISGYDVYRYVYAYTRHKQFKRDAAKAAAKAAAEAAAKKDVATENPAV